MNIVYDVLSELRYKAQDALFAKFHIENIENTIEAIPFLSTEYESQVYIVVEYSNEKLDDIVNSDYVRELAKVFRQQSYHMGEMDRNTSLLILSKYTEKINNSAKIKIEDDPYYFKKYVFSYTDLSRQKALEWLHEKKSTTSVVEAIQQYIGDVDKFERYKNNAINECIYEYFIELLTKISIFPIRIVEQKNIKSVNSFLASEIEKYRDKRKPIEIIPQKLDLLIENNIEEMKIDDIITLWDHINDMKEGE